MRLFVIPGTLDFGSSVLGLNNYRLLAQNSEIEIAEIEARSEFEILTAVVATTLRLRTRKKVWRHT